MDRTERLIRLFHRRWSVSLLAELSRRRGAKLVTLQAALGASPGAVRQALDDLIEMGLVMHNPGYGHPLRPEYVLTHEGLETGAACERIIEASRRLEVVPLILRKWPMPILDSLRSGPRRFGEMGKRLGSVTDRALAMGLKELGGAGLVERRVGREFPPQASYEATGRGWVLAEPVGLVT